MKYSMHWQAQSLLKQKVSIAAKSLCLTLSWYFCLQALVLQDRRLISALFWLILHAQTCLLQVVSQSAQTSAVCAAAPLVILTNLEIKSNQARQLPLLWAFLQFGSFLKIKACMGGHPNLQDFTWKIASHLKCSIWLGIPPALPELVIVLLLYDNVQVVNGQQFLLGHLLYPRFHARWQIDYTHTTIWCL